MSLEGAQRELERKVRHLGSVAGVGVGERGGRPGLVVYLSGGDRRLRRRIPKTVRGVPVWVRRGGPFVAGGPEKNG